MTVIQTPSQTTALSLVCPGAVANVGSLTDAEIDDLLRSAGAVRSELAAVQGSLLAEIERRGRWASGVLAQTQGIGTRAAKRQARVAKRVFGGRDGNDGLEQIAAALAERRIHPDHAALIANQRPDYAAAIAEQQVTIVEQAERRDYDDFVQWLARWRTRVDRTAGRSTADSQRKERKASGGTRPEDGMFQFSATHEPLVGAAIAKQLAVVDNAMWRSDSKLPKNKRRTPTERRADAHAWLVLRPVRSTAVHLPTTDDLEIEAALGRADVTIMVIATVDDLKAGRGELVDGTAIDLDGVIKNAGRLAVVPTVFDSNGVNLWQGRKHRIPTEPLRQAVIARDRHCTFDGCTVPADWCQLHHIIWWSKGGTTDPPNLCLLCSEHHHYIHDNGWQITRQADGTLQWTPPASTERSGKGPTTPRTTTRPTNAPDATGTKIHEPATVHNLVRKEPSSNDSDADAAA